MRKLLLLFFILTLTGCVHSPRKAEIAELEDGNFQISAISEEHWSGDFLSAELLRKLCKIRNFSQSPFGGFIFEESDGNFPSGRN